MLQKATITLPNSSTTNFQNPYSVLRKNIIELYLRPGKIVSIHDLCIHFHISRSPMRDALIRLEGEGLVDLLPQRGIRISKIDLHRVEEERFLRFSVERAVMKLFMERHMPEDMVFLEASIVKQKHLVPTKDFRAMIAVDNEFHQYFYNATKKQFCAETILKSSGHYNRFRLLSCINHDIFQGVISQHSKLIDAINSDNTEQMLDVFDHHLSKIKGEVKRFSAKYPDLFLQSGVATKQDDALKNDFMEELRK